MHEVLIQLEEARFSLYRVAPGTATQEWPWGQAGSAVFLGATVDNVRAWRRFEEVVTRPTGSLWPIPRHLAEEIEIAFDRVWVNRVDDNNPGSSAGDFQLERNQQYVLVCSYQEPAPKELESSYWVAHIFYGVTIPEVQWQNDAEGLFFTTSQTLKAAVCQRSSGKGAVPL